MSPDVLIEVRGLRSVFGTQVVHDGLDMTVLRGEVFGIVGGSGSGKSVLLRTILGLQRPQAGEVRLMGRPLRQLTIAELKQIKAGYGVTFQQGALFSALTVLQNVQLPMLEHLSLSPRALEELALLKVRLVGLPDEAARKEGRPWVAASWLFHLEPLGDRRTRLVSRYRASCSDDLRTRLAFGPALVEPIGFAMDRRMLLTLKELAERSATRAGTG